MPSRAVSAVTRHTSDPSTPGIGSALTSGASRPATSPSRSFAAGGSSSLLSDAQTVPAYAGSADRSPCPSAASQSLPCAATAAPRPFAMSAPTTSWASMAPAGVPSCPIASGAAAGALDAGDKEASGGGTRAQPAASSAVAPTRNPRLSTRPVSPRARRQPERPRRSSSDPSPTRGTSLVAIGRSIGYPRFRPYFSGGNRRPRSGQLPGQRGTNLAFPQARADEAVSPNREPGDQSPGSRCIPSAI